MHIKFYPYTLELKHTFSISTYTRTSTPAILIELEHNGVTGFGEISMPQYLGETVETASSLLKKTDFSEFNPELDFDKILDYVDGIEPGNTAAKAGIDIALHDLYGKLKGVPVRKLYGIEGNASPRISFTIGIDTEEMLIKKISEAENFDLLKIKIGTKDDRQLINTIRKITDKKIIADANQGWKEKEEALELIQYLKEKGVVLIEQPMDKNDLAGHRWLKERSPLPLFADESMQRLSDFERIKDSFHGINIKLMKCTGIREAFALIKRGRTENLMIMLGCMTETSCAISAAAQLAPLADYADLDGNLLIKNDPFKGLNYDDARIVLNDLPGLGLEKMG